MRNRVLVSSLGLGLLLLAGGCSKPVQSVRFSSEDYVAAMKASAAASGGTGEYASAVGTGDLLGRAVLAPDNFRVARARSAYDNGIRTATVPTTP